MGPITVGLCFLIAPFAALADGLKHQLNHSPREVELYRAGNGAALIVAAVWMLYYRNDWYSLSASWLAWGLNYIDIDSGFTVGVAPVFNLLVAGLGVFWFTVGAARARPGYRDGRLIIRSLVKTMFGAALVWFGLNQHNQYVQMAVYVVAGWLLITGATKLLILLSGPGAEMWHAEQLQQEQAHGRAKFAPPQLASKWMKQ